MSDNKALFQALLAGLVLLLAGDVMFVWPTTRAARVAREEIASVEPMLIDLPVQRQLVEELRSELDEKRRRLVHSSVHWTSGIGFGSARASIQRTAEDVGLSTDDLRIRMTADGRSGLSLSERDLPIAVDVTATFDSIFELTRRVELMNEPLRVVRVRIEGRGAEQVREAPILTASFDLELMRAVCLDPENE